MTDIQPSHIVRSFDEQLGLLTEKIVAMGGYVESVVADSMDALIRRDEALAQEVIDRDKRVDAFEEEIDQMAIRLFATRAPMAVDLRTIAMALKISNSLERMSDHAKNNAKRLARLGARASIPHLAILPRMGQTVQSMIKDVLDAYIQRDAEKALRVWRQDEEVDRFYDSLNRELMTYMLEDSRQIGTCIEMQFIAKNIERIGDQATNIAEKVHYMVHARGINRPLEESPSR
ncbi:phosphate signaling complex protein PhoU [Marinivivus vitaminiproducens]|uniref:phosphate signaling complex protein PhoU n=1 Tax=Marinivivus vitaminiproducens TaxID=3035935 RepID=UPI002798B463|nr:phosphate signaling complex protein PhoU [Geminicoccaceae bacterium SCSIO 64248]